MTSTPHSPQFAPLTHVAGALAHLDACLPLDIVNDGEFGTFPYTWIPARYLEAFHIKPGEGALPHPFVDFTLSWTADGALIGRGASPIVEEHTIAGRHVLIRCITRRGTGRRSFDVLDADTREQLTDESFDDYPTDEQIKDVLDGGELLALAEGRGLVPDDLDEAVHQTASKQASEVNDGGLAVQIDYLVAAFGTKGARTVIEDCRPAPQ